jgi:hypothetical protein
VRLLSYRLFSSRVIAVSLYTISLQIALLVVYRTRSLRSIRKSRIYDGVGTFLGG